MTAAETSLTTTPVVAFPDTARLRAVAADVGARSIDRLGQALCGLRGHAMMMRFESTRLSLQCADCGYNTAGWDVGER